jgi:hypothetical protein
VACFFGVEREAAPARCPAVRGGDAQLAHNVGWPRRKEKDIEYTYQSPYLHFEFVFSP